MKTCRKCPRIGSFLCLRRAWVGRVAGVGGIRQTFSIDLELPVELVHHLPEFLQVRDQFPFDVRVAGSLQFTFPIRQRVAMAKAPVMPICPSLSLTGKPT